MVQGSSKASKNLKDIVIPVLGPTGSGKSTFINHVVGSEQTKVGNRTTSCTTKPKPVYVDPIPDFPALKGYRLVLLDTPGFDDTYKSDVEILKPIVAWLADSRRRGALIGGVLYLHDISVKRFNSTACQNLRTFTHLCGDDCMKKTVLVTTNWGLGTNDEFHSRESEMKAKHWTPIIQTGGEVRSFLRNQESAWDIITTLLQCADFQDPLLVQQQLVDGRMGFLETKVGRHSDSVAKKQEDKRNKLEETKNRFCVVQ